MSGDWPLWEVFVRTKGGLAHRHVGSVHAPDAELALRHARDTYTRRQEGVSLWVVPSAEIVASDPDEAGPVVRAGGGQDLPPSDLLRHPGRSEAHLMAVAAGRSRRMCEKRAAQARPIMGAFDAPAAGEPDRGALRLSAAARRRCADPRPAAERMVRACAGARGRPQPRQPGARPDRAGDACCSAAKRGRRATELGVPPRRARFPQLPAGRAAQRRFRADHRAAPAVSRPGSTCCYQRLAQSSDQLPRARFAAKAVKEVAYHRELAAEWTVRLGDGTEESARRMADGLDWCWRFIPELFEVDETLEALIARGIAADPRAFEDEYRAAIGAVLAEAKLEVAARPAPDPRRAARASQRASRPFARGRCSICRAPIPTRSGRMSRAFPRADGRRDRPRDRRGQFDPLRSPARAARHLRVQGRASI